MDMNLVDLPTELLEMCLGHVNDCYDMLRVRRTCRLMRDIVDSDHLVKFYANISVGMERLYLSAEETVGLMSIFHGKGKVLLNWSDLNNGGLSDKAKFLLKCIAVLRLEVEGGHIDGGRHRREIISTLHVFEHHVTDANLREVYIYDMVPINTADGRLLMRDISRSRLKFTTSLELSIVKASAAQTEKVALCQKVTDISITDIHTLHFIQTDLPNNLRSMFLDFQDRKVVDNWRELRKGLGELFANSNSLEKITFHQCIVSHFLPELMGILQGSVNSVEFSCCDLDTEVKEMVECTAEKLVIYRSGEIPPFAKFTNLKSFKTATYYGTNESLQLLENCLKTVEHLEIVLWGLDVLLIYGLQHMPYNPYLHFLMSHDLSELTHLIIQTSVLTPELLCRLLEFKKLNFLEVRYKLYYHLLEPYHVFLPPQSKDYPPLELKLWDLEPPNPQEDLIRCEIRRDVSNPEIARVLNQKLTENSSVPGNLDRFKVILW